ncbi:3-ketosphinganine reductase [Niveomyces insectorum RCEF 264]|uniref:3-dehydrosphinganine reductase n=1 Tax=Niveomyces insectorum RCEF 264 TaxID=1081102 RepID=A0A167WXL1_9HYPO|nr:3-ketosphinganine reductase [Niveomyces insectorum RCEF 264]
MGWFRKNHMPVDGKTVLVTGASEGMGRSAAQQLAAQGANVIVVARNAERLAEVVDECKSAAKSPAQRFRYIAADVTVPDYAAGLVAEAVAWNGGRPLDIVWCIAGVSTPLLWMESSRDVAIGASRHNMDVNFWGAAEMAHAVLRAWLRPDAPAHPGQPRHFVFTSSVVSLFPVVGYAPYTPSKCAVRGLADTLTQETMLYEATHPVRIAVVYPGTILSPGLVRENTTKPAITLHLEKDDPQLTPDAAAAQAIRGLQRGDYFVTMSLLGDLMRWASLGGSPRNNWVLDTLGAWMITTAMYFILWWFHGEIRGHARKNGHPATYNKKSA